MGCGLFISMILQFGQGKPFWGGDIIHLHEHLYPGVQERNDSENVLGKHGGMAGGKTDGGRCFSDKLSQGFTDFIVWRGIL